MKVIRVATAVCSACIIAVTVSGSAKAGKTVVSIEISARVKNCPRAIYFDLSICVTTSHLYIHPKGKHCLSYFQNTTLAVLLAG